MPDPARLPLLTGRGGSSCRVCRAFRTTPECSGSSDERRTATMAHTRPKELTDTQSTDNTFPATASAEGRQFNGAPSPGDRAATSECRSGMMACGMGNKGLKGLLLMAACCGAPLLLLLALPLLGFTLGGLGASVVNTLAVLACPI